MPYLVAGTLKGTLIPLIFTHFVFFAKYILIQETIHNMGLKMLDVAEKNAFLYDNVHAKLGAMKEILTRTVPNDASHEKLDKNVFESR